MSKIDLLLLINLALTAFAYTLVSSAFVTPAFLSCQFFWTVYVTLTVFKVTAYTQFLYFGSMLIMDFFSCKSLGSQSTSSERQSA